MTPTKHKFPLQLLFQYTCCNENCHPKSCFAGGSYARISARVSEIIAEHIHLNRKYHVDTMTTPEWASLQTQANAGLLHLLQKWPDLKSKLYRCFNIQLPQSLRRLVWSLYLENPQGLLTSSDSIEQFSLQQEASDTMRVTNYAFLSLKKKKFVCLLSPSGYL